MILITLLLLLAFVIIFPIFILTKSPFVEALTITVGVTLYHFAMRLGVGTAVNLIMKNRADHKSPWFREKAFEDKLYRALWVRKWKNHIPTYSPDTFDIKQKTLWEIIGATCQAEIVHEIIMLLSLLPMTLIPLLGGAAPLIVTSILSMMIDSAFVVLQRYNRPKLVRLMGRFQRKAEPDNHK